MRQLVRDIRRGHPRRAVESFWHRRHLSAVAWLLMAGFVAFNFHLERQHSDQLRIATHQVLVQGCRSGNELRRTIQGLILSPQSKAQDRLLVKEGRISQADMNRLVALAQHNRARVAPRDCSKAYSQLKL